MSDVLTVADVDEFANIVMATVKAAVAPLVARIAELEQRSLMIPRDGRDGLSIKGDPGEPGRDGKDADPDLIHRLVAEAVAKIPLPVNGKDAPDPDIEAIARKAAALVPAGKDGTDGKDAVIDLDQVAEKAAALVAPGKDGRDGKDADPEAIRTEVAKAVALIPAPKDGQSVTIEDLAPLVTHEVTKAVATLPPAKDGIGVADALLSRDGHLVLTLSDGVVKDVGMVVGRDVDLDHVHQVIAVEVAKIPRPKDGIDGKDGSGFDDLRFDTDEHGHLSIAFERGRDQKSHRIPGSVYRGVFANGTAYECGDSVTRGGSIWIAKAATTAAPGDGSPDWTLAVKRGADGKPGPQGIKGLDGKDGMPGKDLTQVDLSTGRKW